MNTPLQRAATALLEEWGSRRTHECLMELRKALADEQAQAGKPVTDEENERFSQDVSNFEGADPEATKYALDQFLKNRTAPPPAGEPIEQELSDGEIYSRVSRKVAEINATFASQQIVPMTMEDIVAAAGAQNIDVYAASFMCGIRAAETHYKVKEARQAEMLSASPGAAS